MTNNNTAKIHDLRFPFTRLLLLHFTFSFLLVSCDTTEPRNNGVLTLTPLDASCTEVWIKVEANANLVGTELQLFRDNQPTGSYTLTGTDTTFYENNLTPSTDYTYKAEANGTISNSISVNTMETTSQNFSFESFEFGDGYSSSYFNDVWVFDENNIWAVGYISPSQTVDGVYVSNPNIIRWNGETWKLEQLSGTSSGIYGVWALDTNHIFFANGQMIEYKDHVYHEFAVSGDWQQGQGIHKLWGSGADNIWGVGPRGTIVHFNGNEWKKIEFDTDFDFTGITGDKTTGVSYSIANKPSITKIFQLNEDDTVQEIFNGDDYTWKFRFRNAVFLKGKLYLPTTFILTLVPGDENSLTKLEFVKSSYGVNSISGQEINEIYFFGPNGFFMHYNGVRFRYFPATTTTWISGGGHAGGGSAAWVNMTNNKAIITLIRR
ncbi:MAG: hypothetical protein K9J12_17010 [Melioribacteraceae bacterium]|nr:hypothetical protein [Melioribacteraceae bacterium]MCF8263438.1 hypothetical protein [Melioribacteraceae bacterium]MCF8414012.1 hypothetical protein [Melioribacteraceae bacterium]MCF8430436.1 hypothetical protein [Melioribacteraceae bacterium]